MTTFIIAGSFDPFTLGHLHLVKQSISAADKVIVLIASNPGKQPLFDLSRRSLIVQRTIKAELPEQQHKVQVELLQERLTIDVVRREAAINPTFLVRGLRDGNDLAYERNIERLNKLIYPELNTIYLSTPDHLAGVSSSNVRALLQYKDRPDIKNALLGLVHSEAEQIINPV